MNMKMKSAIRREKGAAIVLMMFIVTLLMISGMGLLGMGYQSRLFAVRTSQNMACRVCTDAGLQKAIDAMNTKLTGGTLNDSDLPVSIGETLPAAEGAFSYRVIKNAEGNYVAEAVGARGDFRRTIVALLDREKKSCFDYGVLVKNGCTFAPGLSASAYDSQNPDATGLKTKIGTIGTAIPSVVTKPGTTIDGDLFCGVGGDPSQVISNDGTITGTEYALTDAPEIVQPKIPATLPVLGTNIVIKGSTVSVTPASSGVYSRLDIDSTGTPGKLIVSGGTVTLAVKDFFGLGSGAEIIVQEGSTLIMYVDCGISSMNGASITYNGSPNDPTHIQIYGTSTTPVTWAIKAKNDWTGVIYAPNASIEMMAGGNVYGAIMAESTNFKSGNHYYYDVNLQRTQNTALTRPGQYIVKRWAESSTGYVPDWAQ